MMSCYCLTSDIAQHSVWAIQDMHFNVTSSGLGIMDFRIPEVIGMQITHPQD